MTALQRVNSKR